MKVVFAGTPEFAQVALDAILQAGHAVPLVLTQPDRPAGRGMKLQASPVKRTALAHGIEVLQPRSLRLDGRWPDEAAAARDALQAVQPDVMVVAAYGLILPQWVLDLPRLGCLNIHASLLPRWRGAAPIHRAIEAGDAETGITLMQMDAGLDTGDMLRVARVSIADDDTTASLHDRLAVLGGQEIVALLKQLARGEALARVPQPEAGVTYAHKIEKSEAPVDWNLPAAALGRRVRAFCPFPGASTTMPLGHGHAEEIVKIWGAERSAVPVPAGVQCGQVLAIDAQGIHVACGGQEPRSALCLTQLQRAGGKRLPVADWLRGVALPVGTLLGGHREPAPAQPAGRS